jgi:hypothetical protein
MPDIYCNVWSLNTPSGSDISYNIGSEKSAVLEAHITSVPISPTNLDTWIKFQATKSGSVSFDILDASNMQVLMSGVSSGKNIESITKKSIRLKARFTRGNPSTTPSLDKWSVTYYGLDEDPPRTSVTAIDGTKGLNEYYISQGVTIWLSAEDFPADTGSGVKQTYYNYAGTSQEIYDIESGIHIAVTQEDDWKGTFNVNFWSVDFKGNTEDRTKPENTVQIKIDAERPYVELTSPANEQQVEVPFWVYAEASDNAVIDRVEFDIEPFGERPGLPYADYEPPYEWWCDVQNKSRPRDPMYTTDVNVMVRAQAFDSSGQTWLHEVWVCITNWGEGPDPNIKVRLAKTLDIDINTPSNADSVRFTATRKILGVESELRDSDFSDGCQASFNVGTGIFDVKAYSCKDGTDMDLEYSATIVFIRNIFSGTGTGYVSAPPGLVKILEHIFFHLK